MPNPAPALLPSPALFDVTSLPDAGVAGTIERIPLGQLELAENPRKRISPDGIERLAEMLMRLGQLTPCIAWRPTPAEPARIYDGQRRLLAALLSQRLARTAGHEHLSPVRSLIVLLLDHEPTRDEARRIQAQANRSEELALTDQQEQLRDCWQARAGLAHDDRLAAVCADLGIGARKVTNLLRQLALPDPIRTRVAERPGSEQLSVTMANKLADMHEVAPELALAVAERITTTDLHEKALRDLGAFVHRTVVENEHTYAIRIDGALLDGPDQIEQARAHLAPASCTRARLRARRTRGRTRHADRARQEQGAEDPHRRRATRPRPQRPLRLRSRARPRLRRWHLGHRPRPHARRHPRADRARRRRDRAPRDLLLRRPARRRRAPCRRRAGPPTPSRAARSPRRRLRRQPRARTRPARRAHGPHRSPTASAQDSRVPPDRPPPPRADRLRRRLDRPRPPATRRRHWPSRATTDRRHHRRRAPTRAQRPDPLRGIAQLVARWGAAFTLDPDGVTRTKALGTERMAPKLRDALPGGEHPLRTAVWDFLRPMLSPRLAALHRDAFVIDSANTPVDLAAHRGESSLDELDLDDTHAHADADADADAA